MIHIGEKVYAFATNYRKDRGKHAKVDVGFWVHELPRLMPLCRLLGHRPVVDGVDMGWRDRPARWVACDRCGGRDTPDLRLAVPEGDEPPAIGSTPDLSTLETPFLAQTPRGSVGGQLVLLGALPGFSAEFKVGNKGSEHTLAWHLRLGRLSALYLHTEGFGQGLVRRLNPVGYESRVIGLDYNPEGRFITWQLWAKRDSYSRTDPKWMYGTLHVDPRDKIWGRRIFSYESIGEPVAAVLHLPEDDYPVNLQLQEQFRGRTKRPRRHDAYNVDIQVVGDGDGIAVKGYSYHGGITRFSVQVSEEAGTARARRRWVNEALTRAEIRMMKDRLRYDYRPDPVAAIGDIDDKDW